VATQLGAKRNWSDSDDLAMMFQGAYSTHFYRALHDALHREVDYRNGRAPELTETGLAGMWREISELEKTSANPRATVLVS
jgi:hypothetical protein